MPKNLMFDDHQIFVFPILIWSNVFFRRLPDVPTTMNSVLASFILSWLSSIHILILPISFSIISFMLSSGLKEWIIAWSSAYPDRKLFFSL